MLKKIRVNDENGDISFKKSIFPGGEINVRVDGGVGNRVTIFTLLKSSEDVMTLVMLVDAIRRVNQSTKIQLNMPYIPYARQDRVCNVGEAFSLKVFCNIINELKFDSVFVNDPHSNVAPALLNRVNIVERDLKLTEPTPFYLVSPDAGAIKKCEYLAMRYNNIVKGIVYAENRGGDGAISGECVLFGASLARS